MFQIRTFANRILEKTSYSCSQSLHLDRSLISHVDFQKQLDPKNVDIITVAFNDIRLIKKQAQLIKKFITDKNHTYIVADNSTNSDQRKAIKNYCESHNIAYIPLPKRINKLAFGKPSFSHAIALNLLYKEVIGKRQPFVYCFLDHDVFPLKPYSIVENLGEQDFYGIIRDRRIQLKDGKVDGGWYLWPGFTFIKYQSTTNLKIDYFPLWTKRSYLDTGGKLYPVLFSKYRLDVIRQADDKLYRVQKTAEATSHNDIYHTDCLVLLDNKQWIHMVNGANWSILKQAKNTMIERTLKDINEKCSLQIEEDEEI